MQQQVYGCPKLHWASLWVSQIAAVSLWVSQTASASLWVSIIREISLAITFGSPLHYLLINHSALFMIFYSPHFNPIAFQFGIFQIHWYGLAYLLGFVMVWLGARYDARHDAIFAPGALLDAMTYGLWGVVIGARLAYVFIYAWPFLDTDWLMPFRIWEGGMSFHGGLFGGVMGLIWYARRHKITFLSITDLMAPYIPIALFFGRLANWINGELWGRPTDQSFGMIYPWVDQQLRYPSQWIEALLEGFCLFLLVFIYTRRPRETGQAGGLFLIAYAIFRFVAEFFREPDQQIGFLTLHLSMGQWLCVPMIFVGLYYFIRPVYVHRIERTAKGEVV